MKILLFHSAIFVCSFCSSPLYADEYRYNPIGKVDPFQSLAAAQTAVFGASGRLQKYELSELSLVGTAIGKDSTALIVTPTPIEGFLVRVGDSLGKRGGKIVSLTKKEMIVREFGDGAAGAKLKSALVIMTLSSKVLELKDRATAADRTNGDTLNFGSLSADTPQERSQTTVQPIDKVQAEFLAPVVTPTPTAQPITIPKLNDVPTTPSKGFNP